MKDCGFRVVTGEESDRGSISSSTSCFHKANVTNSPAAERPHGAVQCVGVDIHGHSVRKVLQ